MKVIEVTKENEKRHLSRRASDISDRRKADKLDRLIVMLRQRLAELESGPRAPNVYAKYEAYSAVLRYVDNSDCERTGETK